MDRKEQILDVATELVQTRGYSAFSYQDLSDRLGITKASIHYHFPSKEELGKAVAERYSRQVSSYLDGVEAKSDGPWERLDGYLEMVLGIMKTRDRICAAGSVQSEINVVPAAMGETMCALARHVVGWIANVIEEGRKQGVMQFPGQASDHAAMIFSAAQGAMQYGRAQGEKPGRSVLKQIKESMRREA
ncbi:MAG: TetR/AcrR family transcriptional regulator [Acidobacteriota bacterium]